MLKLFLNTVICGLALSTLTACSRDNSLAIRIGPQEQSPYTVGPNNGVPYATPVILTPGPAQQTRYSKEEGLTTSCPDGSVWVETPAANQICANTRPANS